MSDGQFKEKTLCEAWLGKVELALRKKQTEFGQYAQECAKFYDGPPDWMWQDEKSAAKERGWLAQGAALPNFRIMLNKPFEAVSLYGPALFHQYPTVVVNPVTRPQVLPEALGVNLADPLMDEQYGMAQQQEKMDAAVRQTHANIGSSYLNLVQRIADKKKHSRDAITEGIVRGLGLLFTKIHTKDGFRYPRSEFINESDYVKDPDATRQDDVQWIAVRCVAPKNKVAEEYGLSEDDLKGHFQSMDAQSTRIGRNDAKNRKGGENNSFDLVEYWEIYSKNGFGDKLTTFTGNKGKSVADYSAFGPYCYIVVARGVPFPLNLPPTAHEEEPEQILERVSWPIPYWVPPLCDWPVSELGFYWKGGSVWPVSLMKPLIGPIRFVNWCLSFLADKCAAAGTDYVVALKAAAESIKSQLETGVGPFKLLELSQEIASISGGDVSKLVSVLSAPNFNVGLWQMVNEVIQLIDRLSGLNELLAGMSSTQMRSAEEASVKQANTQIRPDDMAQKVEDWLTLTAKKEILAAQWVLQREDMEAVIGSEAAYVWETQMATQDVERIISDFQYTVEAGSARKPNIANKRQAISEFMQANGPMLQQLAMSGVPGPLNAAIRVWGDANQLDVSQFLLPEPDHNQPPPPTETELEMQRDQADLQMDGQRLQMDLYGKQAELQMEEESHRQDLAFESRKFGLEMKHDAAKNKQDLAIQKQKGQAQVAATRAKARATPSKNGSRA